MVTTMLLWHVLGNTGKGSTCRDQRVWHCIMAVGVPKVVVLKQQSAKDPGLAT